MDQSDLPDCQHQLPQIRVIGNQYKPCITSCRPLNASDACKTRLRLCRSPRVHPLLQLTSQGPKRQRRACYTSLRDSSRHTPHRRRSLILRKNHFHFVDESLALLPIHPTPSPSSSNKAPQRHTLAQQSGTDSPPMACNDLAAPAGAIEFGSIASPVDHPVSFFVEPPPCESLPAPTTPHQVESLRRHMPPPPAAQSTYRPSSPVLPVNSFGICCTIKIGTAKSRESFGNRFSRADGPPVDSPITITSTEALDLRTSAEAPRKLFCVRSPTSCSSSSGSTLLEQSCNLRQQLHRKLTAVPLQNYVAHWASSHSPKPRGSAPPASTSPPCSVCELHMITGSPGLSLCNRSSTSNPFRRGISRSSTNTSGRNWFTASRQSTPSQATPHNSINGNSLDRSSACVAKRLQA